MLRKAYARACACLKSEFYLSLSYKISVNEASPTSIDTMIAILFGYEPLIGNLILKGYA